MIRLGAGGELDLTLSGKGLGRRFQKELLAQNARAEGLIRRLYDEAEPGVLLADEVGKGKTYVALAVAFAALAKSRGGRVLVLTHSTHMAKQWRRRWRGLVECVGDPWKSKWEEDGWSTDLYWSIGSLARDARLGRLPSISFASYETLKKYGTDNHAALLAGALQHAWKLKGLRLRQEERRELIKGLLKCDLRGVKPLNVDKSHAKRILRELDPATRQWSERAEAVVEDELDRMQAKLRLDRGARFELLIVDEAHKLEGSARHRVVTRLLKKRFEKCVLVTATPFALSVHQFQRRLLDFAYARCAPKSYAHEVQALPLEPFRKAVAKREEFPGRADLESRLRAKMVRAEWGDGEREIEHWRGEASAESLLPSLMLERLIDGVLQNNERTHIASRRESLCSSWLAAQASVQKSPLRGTNSRWSQAFDTLVAGSAAGRDPKLLVAVDRLAQLVATRTKVVVFTQRLETSKALARLLEEHPSVSGLAEALERQAEGRRRHVDRIAGWLGLPLAHAAGVVKVMAHSQDCPRLERPLVRRWWKKHKLRLGGGAGDTWADLQPILGRGRRLPIVVRHDAETGSDEHNVEKFNLPSSPLVLIATPKAQEGIDLHHYCRHVVLFDLTWNPAAMEQRIGRVHRLGGCRRAGEKVKVVYCFQRGTYEQVMAARVQKRCEMMRVLLGAGQWLDQDKEITELDTYRMTFPA